MMIALAGVTCRAQSLRFDRLTVSDGLSSNSVYSICEDSAGVLWFGTLDGLSRYDGYQFTVFKHDHADKSSIPHNRVTAIYEDGSRHLWLYDEFTGGIIQYDPAGEQFRSYDLNGVAATAMEESLIFEKADGTLCVRSTRGHLLEYDAAADVWRRAGPAPVIDSLALWGVTPAFWQAFNQYLGACGSSFSSVSMGVREVFRDSGGGYWIATRYDGLYSAIVDHGRYVFTSHLHTKDLHAQIESQDIHDVYEDHSRVVWIGTKNNGLFRYSPYRYKFDHIETIETPQGVRRVGPVRAIAQDDQRNTWIGTDDEGLLRIDPSFRTGSVYLPDPLDPSSIGHGYIRSLWVDEKNRVWIGHYRGFSLYRRNTNDFRVFLPDSGTAEDMRIYDIRADGRGGLWMAGWDLILHVDATFTRYKFFSKRAGPAGFASENIRELELDDTGGLWLAAGEKGLSLFHAADSTFTSLRYSPSDSTGLPSDNLFDIFRDRHNTLWLATAEGLCRFDPLKGTCKTFTVNDGLSSNLVYGILQDDEGFLWLSTTKGLTKFNPETGACRNYDDEDGLQSNEFTENAFFQNTEGVMFFGGVKGLTRFHPRQVLSNPAAPRVMITAAQVHNTSLLQVRTVGQEEIRQHISAGEEIKLRPDQRSVSFDFVGLHYVNPRKNRYAYKLEGFEQAWTQRDANVRFASYTNLAPGHYVFKVKSCSSDGVWSEPVAFRFSIEKPLYSTYWFIVSCAAALIVMGVYAYRWRIAAVQRHQGMKAIQLETELNFLKSQVNPHFLFNTLNNIYALCQVSSRNAAPMVGTLSEMMRYMLYDCAAGTVPLSREVEYLQNYIDLHQLKSHRKLDAFIQVSGSMDELHVAPLLLINFLENSFKHGDVGRSGGFAHVLLNCGVREFTFTVKNSYRENGKPERSGGPDKIQGIGLKNVRHRLGLIYPRKHNLEIRRHGAIFEVVLHIKLA